MDLNEFGQKPSLTDEDARKLLAELRAARDLNTRLHRRVQASEGAEQRLERVRAGYAYEYKRCRALWVRKASMWHQYYADARKQLIQAGVPNHVDGWGPRRREGRLSILIERAIAMFDRRSWWEKLVG